MITYNTSKLVVVISYDDTLAAKSIDTIIFGNQNIFSTNKFPKDVFGAKTLVSSSFHAFCWTPPPPALQDAQKVEKRAGISCSVGFL